MVEFRGCEATKLSVQLQGLVISIVRELSDLVLSIKICPRLDVITVHVKTCMNISQDLFKTSIPVSRFHLFEAAFRRDRETGYLKFKILSSYQQFLGRKLRRLVSKKVVLQTGMYG